MKALLCKEFGPKENLVVEEIDTPIAGKGHVLVNVKAGGLNFPDMLCVEGKYQVQPERPFVPGAEGAGVIEAVGEGVKHVKAGDRVLFLSPTSTGAFATHAVVNAMTVMKIPDSMSFQEAAGLTLVYATSWYALKNRAEAKEGETLLVLGAAGGVGLATVELGKALGMKVIAAASSDEKLTVCKERGADEIINYSTEDLKARVKELTGGKGADVIYDPVGGDLSIAAFRSIAWNGRHLIIGFASLPAPHSMAMNLPLLKNADIRGVFWGAWTMKDPAGHMQNMMELFSMFEAGKIKPHIHKAFQLEDFKDAFAELTGRKAIGKVVFSME